MADANLPSAPRPPRSDQVVRPAGPTEIPIAPVTGAGRDDTSRAGVPVSRPGKPSPTAGTGKNSGTNTSPGSMENPNGMAPVLTGGLPAQSGFLATKAGARISLPEQLVTLLQEFGIPKDLAAAFAVHALMGEGLRLNADSIKAVRAAALLHANPRRATLLAARALAAGLGADDEGLDALIRLLSGPGAEDTIKEPERVSDRQAGKDNSKDTENKSGNNSGSDSQGTTGGEPGGGSGKDPEEEPPKDSPKDSDDGASQGQDTQTPEPQISASQRVVRLECQDEAGLSKALEAAFMDLSSRAASDPGFASLARRGADGRGWLCVPFRITIDAVDFSGYFRIIFNYATSKVERLVAEIDSSGLTRICDLSWAATGEPMLRFMPASLAEGDEFSRLFGKSMQVEIFQTEKAPDLIGNLYREVDGHA